MFANALRTHSRLRVLTATRVALPATRSITSLVLFRTAVPKNVSLSVSRSITTSQVARNETQAAPKELEDSQVAPEEVENLQVAPIELEDSPVASEEGSQVAHVELEGSQVASEEGSQVAHVELEGSQVASEAEAPSAPLHLPSNTLFVGNIPWKSTEEDVRKIFSQFGEIEDLRVHLYQDGRTRGTCHIDFATKDGIVATMASLAQKPFELAGRTLRVEVSDGSNRKLVTTPNVKLFYKGYVGEESEIRTIFQQFSNSIVSVQPLRDPRTGKLTETGFVGFNNVENATQALEAINGTQAPNGQNLTVAYARPMRSNELTYKVHYSVYASREESEIRSIFQKFNDSIVDVQQLKTLLKSGFITFNSDEAAKEALVALNGSQTPNGEELAVSYAFKPNTRRFRSNSPAIRGKRTGSKPTSKGN